LRDVGRVSHTANYCARVCTEFRLSFLKRLISIYTNHIERCACRTCDTVRMWWMGRQLLTKSKRLFRTLMHSHVIASLYGVIIRSAKEWWLFREGEHLW